MLLIGLAMSRVCWAGWEPTRPGDPNRNWGVTIGAGSGYDDNFFSAENNRQAGLVYYSHMALRASVPLERSLVGLNYDYQVSYPRDIHLGGINQTHNLALSANYIPTPRLTLGLNEVYISSVQPEIVRNEAGAPVNVLQRGDYMYNHVAGSLSYALAPRWNLAANGSWDIWRYAVSNIAAANDREGYQTTLSMLYLLDPRMTTGVNYQYSQSVFTNPGPANAFNAESHTAYLSVVRLLNPRLSLQLNSGYTYRVSGNGAISTSPSELGSLVYNYGPSRAIALSGSYSLSEASFAAARQFSASENTALSLRVNHQITPRLSTAADVTYVLSSFSLPVGNISTAQEQAFTGHIGFAYVFRDWLSTNLDYSYTRLLTTNLPGLTFERNQINLGLSWTY